MKKAIIVAGVAALMLTGCAGEVELSEEDTVRVAQYAADLVLKYDNNYKERLLTLDEQAEAREKLRLAAEKDEKLQELLEQKNNAKTEKDTGKTETGTNNGGTEGETQEEAVMYALNDVVKVDGFTFQNNGYDVLDEYPEVSQDGNNMAMELTAASGKKLLVLKYGITNITDSKAECNLFDKDISAKVVVNGNINADSMITMLLNDFSTLKTDIDPGVTYEAVLIFEIPEEASDIQSLALRMTVEGNTYNIQQ